MNQRSKNLGQRMRLRFHVRSLVLSDETQHSRVQKAPGALAKAGMPAWLDRMHAAHYNTFDFPLDGDLMSAGAPNASVPSSGQDFLYTHTVHRNISFYTGPNPPTVRKNKRPWHFVTAGSMDLLQSVRCL